MPAALLGKPCEQICFDKVFSKRCVWFCDPDEKAETRSSRSCGDGRCSIEPVGPSTKIETEQNCPEDCDCTGKGRLLRALKEGVSLTPAEEATGPTHLYGVIQYDDGYQCVVFTLPQLIRTP